MYFKDAFYFDICSDVSDSTEDKKNQRFLEQLCPVQYDDELSSVQSDTKHTLAVPSRVR